ncbi:SnoaL-like domain protein [Pelagimonas phthalicica]|uniref:SnoaL-like domain protein n=1 Tax=Pelagimonas phthalicica TaxID=1037362 RepID=A0A238JHX5_9RHOB|nr:nuclear transport factor 2 family protein [Pelagimonas phthalicica]TDS89826.1 hypothetical protein CLV87_3878 [Pelagimonas phthalicica]SMX29993.1 SnoaL-like domain protein [Pelagimonas phthalicica]
MTSRIETFLASLSDLDQATTLITEDAKFIAVRAETYADLPLYGTYTGSEGLRAFIAALRQHFDTQSFVVDDVIENDTTGAAFGRFEHIIRQTRKTFRSHWALKTTFHKGKLSSYHFYEDTAALEEAMNQRTTSKETLS